MSKKNRDKAKRSKNQPHPPPTVSDIILSPPAKKDNRIIQFLNSVWKFSTKSYTILTAIITLLGGYFLKDQIADAWRTPQEKYEHENFIPGIFLPNEVVIKPESSVVVAMGGCTFSIPNLDAMSDDGFNLKRFIDLPGFPFELKAKIIHERFYISATFKDLQKEEIVGVIEYQKWKLFKPSIFTFKANDQALEVIDRSGNIIFNMAYSYPNIIKIYGYFVSTNLILVMSDRMHWFSKSSTDLIKKEMLRIHSSM